MLWPSDIGRRQYVFTFYHVFNLNGKEKLYEGDDDEEKNNAEEEDVDNGSVEKVKESGEVLMYYEKLKKKSGHYRKISNVLFALYSKISWNILQHGASRILQDVRNAFETLLLQFPVEKSPILLVFEEERERETPFGIHIGNEDLGEDRRVSGEFPNDLISGITSFCVH